MEGNQKETGNLEQAKYLFWGKNFHNKDEHTPKNDFLVSVHSGDRDGRLLQRLAEGYIKIYLEWGET